MADVDLRIPPELTVEASADSPPVTPVVAWARGLGERDPWSLLALGLEVVVLAAITIFILFQIGPRDLIADTTPAGGDMGAHVWGPAYLRDHLLSEGRLAGWAPDWYAGFPAYHFYMVVPALMIIALDTGFEGWVSLLPFALALGLAAFALLRVTDVRVRRIALAVAALILLFGVGLPYGVAFKWISVIGVLALPICCYAAGRLAELPFPGPPLLAIGSVVFLFNTEPAINNTGRIIGGNLASTLAGEFSFSISFAFLVLYIGFLLRGLRRGGHRGVCAVLLALCALCHIIPAIYAVIATVVALLVSLPLTKERLRWFLPIGPVAVAISAFWVAPFYLRSAYLNDMGWEKIPGPETVDSVRVPGITEVPLTDFLWSVWWDDARYGAFRDNLLDLLVPTELYWVAALAFVGAVVSILLKIRIGVLLAACTFLTTVLFIVTPQGRLWNARLLPFLLLSMCLLAALAVGEVSRAIAALLSDRPERNINPFSLATPVVAGLVVWVVVGLPLGVLPFTPERADGVERFLIFESRPDDRSIIRSWAEWNYSGYERKAAFPEYHGLIELMKGVGDDPDLGCGRAMWEYEYDRLNPYGTPMAPMLLPFWTDGCIGSMEGLYFEASATTPYHFLNQRALSENCSCAQRDLPYGTGFDIDLGVQQLQMMGVRYYLAFTDVAVAAASTHPDLTEVASDDVWHIYLVADSDPVVALDNEPVVLDGVEPGMAWVGPASKWFQDPARWSVLLAEDGPDDWARVEVGVPNDGVKEELEAGKPGWTQTDVLEPPPVDELPSVTVSNVDIGRDGISFDVSEPGVPVLVKTSYFPNWQASGADGPYRVTPNLMVVIPTDTHVELSYGWTGVDIGSYAVSGIGLAGAAFLLWRPRRRDDGDGTDLFFDGPAPIVPRSLIDRDGDGDDGDDEIELEPVLGPPEPSVFAHAPRRAPLRARPPTEE